MERVKYFTGVGSRETPKNLSQYIKTLAQKLDNQGYILRSGGASGADSFFESGATNKKIYLPWPFFNNLSGPDYVVLNNIPTKIRWEAENIVSQIHPNWKYLSSGARKLMTRNVFQVLSEDLKTPSKFLICWTPNGQVIGGSGITIKIALAHDVPVFNLAKPEDKIRIDRWLGPEFG